MTQLDNVCVNAIRMLAADAVEKAKSGHPGLPMGAATMAYVLWTLFLRHNPSNPKWLDRDRFVLSAGHGSMLLYSLLYLTGYDLSLEDLKNFRQWGSKTPGHPEFGETPGVETTTGPLGQGFGNGVGMAIAERALAAKFNRPGHEIVDHFTYAIVSDGDLMEGLSHEAASLAGHLKLGKLIYFYDDNQITIDGSTELSFTENRCERFRAYGWHVQEVFDGNDVVAIEAAIRNARGETERPSLIAVKTHIGFGSPNKQNTSSAHGEPLGEKELGLTKQNLGWPQSPSFFVPDEALSHFRQTLQKGQAAESDWEKRFASYEKAYPDLALEWRKWWNGEFSIDFEKVMPVFAPGSKATATRNTSGIVLNTISSKIPNLLGGSADLAPSNKTMLSGQDVFKWGSYNGRNFHFGVREHAMGAALNGMALHGGLIPYGGTFLVFSDYMRPSIRVAALMKLHVIYVFTHDSIGLGEDGPTHQPIEHLAALRAMPGLTVIRPCDANETSEAWRFALENKSGPVALALTRQDVPILDRATLGQASGAQANSLRKGAYVLKDFPDGWENNGKNNVILIGSGSEVHILLDAATKLDAIGIGARVVSMPSWELFEQQPKEYRDQVLPPMVKARVSMEAGSTQGWHQYVGPEGVVIGMDHFGASAPYQILYEKFGLTTGNAVAKARALVQVAGKA